MCYFTVIRNISQFRQKIHFLLDLVSLWCRGNRDEVVTELRSGAEDPDMSRFTLRGTICDPQGHKQVKPASDFQVTDR